MTGSRTTLQKATVYLKGMAMGAADVVPGVSGGTIAFISGIYEELIKTVDGLTFQIMRDFSREGFFITFKKYNLAFLLALFLGIATSVVSLSKAIAYLLKVHPILVWSFFFGLVLASIIYVGKQIGKYRLSVIAAILIGSVVSYYITIAEPVSSPDSWWYLLFSGFLAIVAMILPGISGAFILLILGSYEVVLGSIGGLVDGVATGDSDLLITSLGNLALVGIGAIVGLKTFSRALTYLFDHFKDLTLGLLTGFMIGSLNKLWPWKQVLKTRTDSHGEEVPFLEKSVMPFSYDGEPLLIYAILLAIAGFAVILLLEKLAVKKP